MAERLILLTSTNQEKIKALEAACRLANLNVPIQYVHVRNGEGEHPTSPMEALEIARIKTMSIPFEPGIAVVSVQNCIIAEEGQKPYLLAVVHARIPVGSISKEDIHISDPIRYESSTFNKRICTAAALASVIDRY